jgi:hypothetical protein
MSRRVTGGALVVASALLGVPQSYGDTPPPAPQLPLATCATRVNDGPTDGIPTFGADNVNGVPTVPDPRGNVPSLDMSAVTIRITDTKVIAFWSIASLPTTFRDTDSAYGYILWFSRGVKMARFDHVYPNPALQAQGLAPTTGLITASVGTSPSGGNALRGVGGGIDHDKGVVYVYADRDSLEEQTGGPIVDGEELTAVNARTELWETNGANAAGVVRRPADKTEATGDAATWHVRDDRCFAPAQVAVPNATVDYGDAVTLTATVTDDAGKALGSHKVSFTVPGESAARTLTTDANGTVRVAMSSAPLAKTYKFPVTYKGDEYSGAGQANGTLTVRPETIRIAPLKVGKAGSARTVTATLTENDPRAFARAQVVWYVNGKKAATLLTDSAGRSVFKGAKPGQKVQARYLGASGRYAPATSNTVVA